MAYQVTNTIIKVNIPSRDEDLLPVYKTSGASGADLKADITESIILNPGQIVIIPTGIYVEIPEGFEIQVRSRSGLAANNNVVVLNSPGTIDSDYRGEIKVILINHHATNVCMINRYDRIAQIVVSKVERAEFAPFIGLFSATTRNEGRFGSTGV